jgi:two-component system chemotaxis sensor kinase CheA
LLDQTQEPLLEMFIFETDQLLTQLEQQVIGIEKSGCIDQDVINEIFRIMHTIKGSSAMMNITGISSVAHSAEDLFYILRKDGSGDIDRSRLSDIILEIIDFIKEEIQLIGKGDTYKRDAGQLTEKIRSFMSEISGQSDGRPSQTVAAAKPEPDEAADNEHGADDPQEDLRSYSSVIFFEDGCEMEGVRAFSLICDLKGIATDISHFPEDLANGSNIDEIIRRDGIKIKFKTVHTYEEVYNFLAQTIFLKKVDLVDTTDESIVSQPESGGQNVHGQSGPNAGRDADTQQNTKGSDADDRISAVHHSIISVNVSKLDKLMDLVGELVISEAMVTQNPDLEGLELDNFQKAARQHRKIIGELQDIAMSIRMVPLSATFQKMHRIVRDMSRKLGKDVKLEIIGEETEVDKNIIEHISDPLMHLIRNSVDHGIEPKEERVSKGKPETGTVTLEAKNAGGDVLIIVKDDGRGLDRQKILVRAKENGLVNRPENELTDRDIFSFVFLPGFSTKEKATEYSGRGVGMDVVTKNIGAIGGNVSISSVAGAGTAITIKIPLTLAIMDGMTIGTGGHKYTIPTLSIRESFKAKDTDVFSDPDGNEMIMIRGECYPVLRLYEAFKLDTSVKDISDGIIVMVENQGKCTCLFTDELIGEQQVVVKALPDYIKKFKKVKGVAGCTLLGDGSISLILDIGGLIEA